MPTLHTSGPAGPPAAAEEPGRVRVPEALKLELRRLLAEALIADVRADQAAHEHHGEDEKS